MKTGEITFVKHARYSEHYKKDLMEIGDFKEALTEHDNEIKALIDGMVGEAEDTLLALEVILGFNSKN